MANCHPLKTTKALVMRNHEVGNTYADMLFSLFGDESVNWDAAKAVGDIGSGGKDVLTKKNFAVLKVSVLDLAFLLH